MTKETAPRTAYLFPDTNLFLQCNPPEQLNWAAVTDAEEIILVVTRPVQQEIDKHKNNGSSRRAKRSRKASTLIRQTLGNPQQQTVIKESSPRVVLALRIDLKPDDAVSNRLDYDEHDDRLVGIVHGFESSERETEILLLTHDTGPMASAAMVGVNYAEIPEEWLLPPESDDAQRELNALKAENLQLRKAGPEFDLLFEDEAGNALNSIDIEVTRYMPLSSDEVSAFMDRIRMNFPPETEFDREQSRRDGGTAAASAGLSGLYRTEYIPAAQEDIEDYTENKYPKWLERTEGQLRNLHLSLLKDEGFPGFCFLAGNTGSRPAKDALVSITAMGDIEVFLPNVDEDDQDEDADGVAGKPFQLGRPPRAPQGKWETRAFGLAGLSAGFGNSHRGLFGPDMLRPIMPNITPHDPNGFYWKPERPEHPCREMKLTCDMWRHSHPKERFDFQLCFPLDSSDPQGALKCAIHAENLAMPKELTVPVRIRIRECSAYEAADKLVSEMCDPLGGLLRGT